VATVVNMVQAAVEAISEEEGVEQTLALVAEVSLTFLTFKTFKTFKS